MTEFERELTSLLNCQCLENESNTPDFVLAKFLVDSLASFNNAIRRREAWYGRDPDASPGGMTNVAEKATVEP